MIKKTFFAFLIVLFSSIAVLAIYAAFQGPEYKISRSIHIMASAEKIFPYINDSKKADSWMAWNESDPQMKSTYSGPEQGVGSTTEWESAGQMGKGKATVIESIANKEVKTKLEYYLPRPMEQLATLSLEADEKGTRVTWSVEGRNTFISRFFCALLNMDKTVGTMFDTALMRLKNIVEKN